MAQGICFDRRNVLRFAPAALLGFGPASDARTVGYPDALSQSVLRHRIDAVDSGPGEFEDRVHRNFPRIIEHNVALRGPRAAAELLDGLSEQELSDLAILYTNASMAIGGGGRLLPLLVRRLDDDRLLRISEHFGFAPTYAALSAVHPHRTSRFAMRANANTMEPRIDQFKPKVGWRVNPDNLRAGMQKVAYVRAANFTKYLYYSPYEIYLDFRTAPVGSLSVAGALWETAVVLSTGVGTAYLAGELIGTRIVEPLIRNYAPSLYEKIGSIVASSVDLLSRSWLGSVYDQGSAQRTTAPLFGSSSLQINSFALGGDFNVSSSWSTAFSSGGGCHPICIDVSY